MSEGEYEDDDDVEEEYDKSKTDCSDESEHEEGVTHPHNPESQDKQRGM